MEVFSRMRSTEEALGALFGLQTFQKWISHADVLLWIDNEAAEGCLNKGYSPDKELAALAGETWLLADNLDITLWIMRVPSSHNVADPLSREDVSLAKAMDWEFVPPLKVCPPGWHTRWSEGGSHLVQRLAV